MTALPADLAAELVIVRENALRYRGVRTDGLAAHLRKVERRTPTGPAEERRRRAYLRSRVRYCEPCGRSWTELDGRLCPQCNRLGEID